MTQASPPERQYPSPPERSAPPEQPDQVPTPAPPASASPPQYSPDGRWYWDGRQWRLIIAEGPAQGRPYAPPDARATATVTLVALVIGGQTLSLVGEGLALLPRVAPFALLSGGLLAFLVGVLTTLVDFAGPAIASATSLAGFVGAAIAVPMWMRRCYSNLPALGATELRWSPAMAAGAWFIPCGSLILPYLVARDLWAKPGGRLVPSWPLLELWWGAWVVLNLVGHIDVSSDGITFGAEGRGPFNSLAALGALVAGVLLILITRRITRHQRDRYSELLRSA